MDNIIEEINVQEKNNNDTSEKEETMSVMTGSCSMDWKFYLDLDHILELNEIPTTYNVCLRKKINILIKVKPDIDYVCNYANDLIERDYCVHVLKEKATNTLSLSSIPESATASKAFASATVQTRNSSPAAKEERNSPSIAGSTISESLAAVSMITSMKVTQEAQMNTNTIIF